MAVITCVEGAYGLDDVNTLQSPETGDPHSSSLDSPFPEIPQLSSPENLEVEQPVDIAACNPFGQLERPDGVEYAPRQVSRQAAAALHQKQGGFGIMDLPDQPFRDSDIFGNSDDEPLSDYDDHIEIMSDESWDGSTMELK